MKKQTVYDITALEMGISNQAWDFMYERDPYDSCVDFMLSHKYDILPLKNQESRFNYFLVTDEWNNYGKIKSRHKSTLPRLKANSNFLTLLSEFAGNKDKYFLLHQGGTIVGLISVANFSYREICRRLYNELAELEIMLADWVFKEISEGEAFEILLKKNQSANSKSVLGQYLIDKQTGNDGPFKEYIYLSSLHSIIKETRLHINLGFDKKKWDEIANPLFKIRNAVAHPVRSIFREKDDFKTVLVCLEASRKITAKLASN